MDTPKKLTLEGMSEEDFKEWRKVHISPEIISQESLAAIRIATGVTFDSNKYGVVCGEKGHSHSYRGCLGFEDRNSDVLHRLIAEIERYQELLGKLRGEIEQGRGIRDY